MSLDQRDISIITQSSTHDAAAVYAATAPLDENGNKVWDAGVFEQIRQTIVAGSLDTINALIEPVAVAQIQAAFPGSTVAPAPGPFDTGAHIVPPVPQPNYAPPAPAVGYQPPMVPQAPYPPQPVQQQPPAAGVRCPKCQGDAYDNRQDNQRKRTNGFRLSADIKCKRKECGGVVWPSDFQAYAQHPYEPR